MRRAIAAARGFAGEGEAADRLTILAEEWVANVVEHGQAAPGSLIVLTFRRDGRRFSLTASDAGDPFDPRTAGPVVPDPVRGGGAGLAMMRAWSTLDYRRVRGRNWVRLQLL